MRIRMVMTSLAFLALGACSGVPTRDSSMMKGPTTDAKVGPTYAEKVDAVTVNQFRSGECSGSSWENADWRMLVEFANACVKAGDWLKVEKIGDRLAVRFHMTPWGPYFMSLSAASRKDYPRAVWLLELALKKAPGEGLFHYQLGRIAWETGDTAAAIREFKASSDMNPSLVEAHTLMGMLALQKQDHAAAGSLFTKALKVDSRYWPALMGLASVKMKAGEWEEAEGLLEKSVRANPRSSKARVALAQIREQHLKKLAEALQSYKELRSLATEQKLDEGVKFDLDEKIQSLEKSLSQVQKVNQVTSTVRTPAEQRKVTK
jgi:tetratricopeptide (TPR) repeat protein